MTTSAAPMHISIVDVGTYVADMEPGGSCTVTGRLLVGTVRNALTMRGDRKDRPEVVSVTRKIKDYIQPSVSALGQQGLVGASRKQIFSSVIAESLLLALAASAVGVLVGVGVASALRELLFIFGTWLPTTQTPVDGCTVFVGLAAGVIVTLAAGVIPAVRSTAIAPLAGVQGQQLPVRGVRCRVGFPCAPSASSSWVSRSWSRSPRHER